MKHIEYIDDCKKLQKLLLKHNIEATLAECQDMWEKCSSDLCANWLFIPEGDELWDILKPYMPKF